MSKSIKNIIGLFCMLVLCILGASCTVNLVQPYDADLYANTESFYKKASEMIIKGVSVSPKLPNDIRAIPEESKEQHPGHYNQFKKDYDALLVDCNSLILRSLSNSGKIDKIGRDLQAKIENAITNSCPSSCDTLQSDFPDVSLTTRNYIDLKCLIGRWSEEHQGIGENGAITDGKQILKKSNWESRSRTLFNCILAIQTAEASKKED